MKLVRALVPIAAALASGQALAQPAAAAQPGVQAVEFPLSCKAAAKAPALKARETGVTNDEQRGLLKQALAADPNCAMAKAWLSTLTPGAEGKALLDAAVATPGLSELEKDDLQGEVAVRNDDSAGALAAFLKGRDLAPNCPTQLLYVSMGARWAQNYPLAIEVDTHATQIDPGNKTAWNELGYTNMALRHYPEAIAALRKYVEIVPVDPNGHDSLAEALMASNQLEESAAEFRKALEMSPTSSYFSWTGIASIDALEGDWDGARAAIVNTAKGTTNPQEKAWYEIWKALTWAAQGKTAEALKAVDAFEKSAKQGKLTWEMASVPNLRCGMLLGAEKYAEALNECQKTAKANPAGATEGQLRSLHADALGGVLGAEAHLGRAAEAEKTLADVEALFANTPDTAEKTNHLAISRGLVAEAKRDFKGAIDAFSKCTDTNDGCRVELALAQDQAGDVMGAAHSRDLVLGANRRDPWYWPQRARAAKDAKTAERKSPKLTQR